MKSGISFMAFTLAAFCIVKSFDNDEDPGVWLSAASQLALGGFLLLDAAGGGGKAYLL